jgi:hypothetical protein
MVNVSSETGIGPGGSVPPAAAEFRRALARGEGVEAAVRWCCYQDPGFMTALCYLAIRNRFGDQYDVREITAFVRRIRDARRESGDTSGFPCRESEAIIRGVLGEDTFRHVDPLAFSYPEIMIPVLTTLLAEWQPSPAEVQALFTEAAGVLSARLATQPEIVAALQRWADSGMPQSPFATLGRTCDPVRKDS